MKILVYVKLKCCNKCKESKANLRLFFFNCIIYFKLECTNLKKKKKKNFYYNFIFVFDC